MGEYSVLYSQSSCELKIVHSESNIEVFKTIPHKMVQAGVGNVDKYASTLIENGDIQHFPKVTHWSADAQECPQFEINNDLEGKDFVVLKGQFDFIERKHVLWHETHIIDYAIQISLPEAGEGIVITSSIEDPDHVTNFMAVSYASAIDEEIYGLGLQYTEWNFKGKSVPIISSEQGVGRGA